MINVKNNYDTFLACAGISVGFIASFTVFKHRSMNNKISLVASSLILSCTPWIYKKTLLFFNPPPRMKNFDQYKKFHDTLLNQNDFKSVPLHMNYADYKNNEFEVGNDIWSSNWDNRRYVQPSTRAIIKEIFKNHVQPGSTILEIGSNELFMKRGTSKRYSHLGTLVPNEYLDNLTYSDYIGSVAKKYNYLHLDLRKDFLSEDQKKNVIVAINVADVMKREDLALLAKGISTSLTSKGKVLFLADRPLEYTSLFAKFSDPNLIAYPAWKDENRTTLGVKVIEKRLLQEAINSLQPDHKTILSEILDLPPTQRFVYFNTAIFYSPALFTFLDILIKNLRYEYHDKFESYEEDMIKTFESNGFDTLENGFKENSMILSINEEPPFYDFFSPSDSRRQENYPPFINWNNTLKLDPREGGSLEKFNSNDVPFNCIKVMSCFHTIVFQKKE